MALRDILVKFLVDVDQTPLKEADEAAGQLIKRLRQLADAAGVTAVALGAKKLFGFIEDTVEAANMVDVFAKRLDVTTQQVQEFQAIAGVTGLQMNFFQHAFRTLNFQVAQSKPEFAELARAAGGVKFNFKDTGELFWQVGEALSSVSDKTRRAYLAQTLLGRSAQQLLPIFSASKEEIEAFRKKIQEVSEVFSKQFIEKAKVTWFQTNIMGLMWMKVAGLLTEQLLPAFDYLLDKLQSLAKWTQDWIKDGSAMNAMIAAAITGVIALTVAFGGFVLEVLAVVAPFALLFLLIDDFVTFLRGGTSVIGDWIDAAFGEGSQDKARKGIQDIWNKVKEFWTWFTSNDWGTVWKGFYDAAAAWGTKVVDFLKKQIADLASYIAEQLRGALGDTAANALGIRKPQQVAAAVGAGAPDVEATNSAPLETQALDVAWDKFLRAVDAWQPFGGRFNGENDAPVNLPPIVHPLAGPPALPPNMSIDNSPNMSVAAPQITNQITVQGNATPATAREIADRTGKATAASLGRDRSAVGAAVGIPQ